MYIKKGARDEKKEVKVTIKPRFKLFYILSFFIILFNIIDSIIIIKEVINGTPMWQTRNWRLSPFGSSNPLLDRRSFVEELFRTLVLTPFETIIPPITAFFFFNSTDKKQRYKLLINSIIVLVTSSIAGGGGRLGFLYYFGCFLLSFYVIFKNKKHLRNEIKKSKKILLCMLIIGIIAVVILTSFRTGVGNFVKQTYKYFALPPTLLSIWLPSLEETTHTYGMLTTFGLHSYFFRVLNMIGLDGLVPEIYNNSFTHILNAEIFKDVGFGVGNAFVTPIYYFFIDGGYPFVCIASLLFGYIVSKLYDKFERNINIRSFTMYSLIMYGVFITFMRIQTAIPAYIISFVLMLYVLRAHREVHNENIANELNLEEKIEVETEELISVIIPVYNVEKYLKECLDSVINQTYKNIEIILVNDGSTDNSRDICESYAKLDNRIKVINKENAGVSSARNRGVEEAKGEWITFIDADDWVESEYCSKLYQEVKSNADTDIAICGYNRVYGDEKEVINCKTLRKTYNTKQFFIKVLNVQNSYGFCHMKLIRKACIGDTKFNENIVVGEDALFNMELVRNINDQSVVRRYDENYANKYLKSIKEIKKYIFKNYKEDIEAKNNYYNYAAYHVLLVAVNYCFNPKNNKNYREQVKLLKEICGIEEFKEAIRYSNFNDLSKTRAITLLTIKFKLYIATALICKIRQLQFKKTTT